MLTDPLRRLLGGEIRHIEFQIIWVASEAMYIHFATELGDKLYVSQLRVQFSIRRDQALHIGLFIAEEQDRYEDGLSCFCSCEIFCAHGRAEVVVALEIRKDVSCVECCGLVGEGRENRAPDSAAEVLIAWLGAVENSVGGVYQKVVMHELCRRELL